MTTKRITMQKIKDVLRLKHAGGLSLRQIERSLNLSIGVISKYSKRAKEKDIGWPLPDGMSDQQLLAILQPGRKSPKDALIVAMPNFDEMRDELSNKGMTRQLLWEEYVEASPGAYYSYSRFTVLFANGAVLRSCRCARFILPERSCLWITAGRQWVLSIQLHWIIY